MASVYRFGDFAIDAGTRRLLRGDQEVHLTPKAFDLLQILIEDRSRAVPKSELQQRIWPSTFVEETNLAGLVAEIRRALDSGPGERPWIRTVYGYGYQFAGEVTSDAAPVTRGGTRLWLVIDRRPLPLMEGVNLIGRAHDAAIPLDSPGTSRHHARIVVANGSATIEDAGSKTART
jgi:DNA-binding winged helix-turn-helix (wHTH) protein